MNSLKTLLMVAVLATVAYGVYVSINKDADNTLPPASEDDWQSTGPQVSLPEFGGEAPSFAMDAPGGFTPSGMPPMPGRSDELSSAEPFSQGAPLPPFDPAPMPPPIASTLNPPPVSSTAPAGSMPPISPITAVDAGRSDLTGPGAAPMPPAGMTYGMQTIDQPRGNEIRPEFAKFLGEARAELAQGRFRETLGLLSSRYGEPGQTESESAALTELLDQVAGTVIYSTGHYLEAAYEVQAGDRLETIADQYDLSAELLAKINGIADPAVLEPGRQLKVVRGPFHAVVKLEEHEMVLWLRDLYAGRFPIGVGTDEAQLEGSFEVRDKVRDPAYYAPGGNTFEPNNPLNPLGTRRLGLGGNVGIHGTNDPAAVGKTGGPGNIALGDRDADDVFDILSLGSRVVIRR